MRVILYKDSLINFLDVLKQRKRDEEHGMNQQNSLETCDCVYHGAHTSNKYEFHR